MKTKEQLKVHRHRNYMLNRLYDISLTQYNDMLSLQNNSCAICQKPSKEFKKSLAVDHCHTYGDIRGLLCDKCNRGLGLFKDSPLILAKAIQYYHKGKIRDIYMWRQVYKILEEII